MSVPARAAWLPPHHGWRREDLRAWLGRAPARPWSYEVEGRYVRDAKGTRVARVADPELGLLLVLLANAAEPLMDDLDRIEEERDDALGVLLTRPRLSDLD